MDSCKIVCRGLILCKIQLNTWEIFKEIKIFKGIFRKIANTKQMTNNSYSYILIYLLLTKKGKWVRQS